MKTSAVRFLLYFRVSTKGQGESGLGLDAQRAYLAHFIPADAVTGELTEVASGKDVEGRPVLRAALERCKAEGLTLAVAKLDRLSRTTEHVLDILAQLDGRLFAADVPVSPGERMDKFIVTMLAALADRERELISIRTRQALAAKKERDGSVHPVKGHVSNFTPEGRRKAAARKRAATSERFRQTVHYARLQREHGSTFQEIADKLNAEGYSSTTGKPFHATTVRRMLTA